MNAEEILTHMEQFGAESAVINSKPKASPPGFCRPS
jgi:hypothetical protein